MTLEQRISKVLEEIEVERYRQEEKWGDQRGKHPETWLAILGEEFGETCRDVIEGNLEAARKEIIQVAAVASAMAESLDMWILRKEYGCKE